jgi:hypothetical protein
MKKQQTIQQRLEVLIMIWTTSEKLWITDGISEEKTL